MILRPFVENTLPSFNGRLAVIPNFLPVASFESLKKEIEAVTTSSRSHIPLHRKGGTISYDTLKQHAPKTLELYQSSEYQNLISRIIGEHVIQTPSHHPSSLAVLLYERPGDHITWHYDRNFYKGRYFTALLAIENRGHAADGLSSVRLLVRKKSGDIPIPTPPNTLVLFEGSEVLHRTTRLKEGERRIMLSMTFSTNPHYSWMKDIMRRVKDSSFFGIGTLWK